MRTIIAFSAVGSLQEKIKPRDFVVPDQVFDRTKGVRPWTFFEGGAVAHVGFADPFDEGVAKIVRACGHSLEGEGVVLHDRGTLVCIGAYIPCCLFCAAESRLLTSILPVFQRALNSPPVPKATCTVPGAAVSLTCPACPKPSWRAKQRSLTR